VPRFPRRSPGRRRTTRSPSSRWRRAIRTLPPCAFAGTGCASVSFVLGSPPPIRKPLACLTAAVTIGSGPRPLTIEELDHWVLFGGTWRTLQVVEGHATVELCTCTSEAVERRETSDPRVIARLRTAE
jgi:hypothetical protein